MRPSVSERPARRPVLRKLGPKAACSGSEEGQELCEPELEEVRSRMITQDDVLQTQVKLPDGSWSISTEKSLLSLLDRNPRNQMAFEYLMAVHLLTRDSRGGSRVGTPKGISPIRRLRSRTKKRRCCTRALSAKCRR